MTFNLSRIESADPSSKDSAQSPAWSRKALPCDDQFEVVQESTGLAGEDERGLLGEFGLDAREVLEVGPRGALGDRRAIATCSEFQSFVVDAIHQA